MRVMEWWSDGVMEWQADFFFVFMFFCWDVCSEFFQCGASSNQQSATELSRHFIVSLKCRPRGTRTTSEHPGHASCWLDVASCCLLLVAWMHRIGSHPITLEEEAKISHHSPLTKVLIYLLYSTLYLNTMADITYETCPTSAPFFGFMGVTAALCFASKERLDSAALCVQFITYFLTFFRFL